MFLLVLAGIDVKSYKLFGGKRKSERKFCLVVFLALGSV